MDEELLQQLTNLYIWSNPNYFKEDIEKVIVQYYNYYSQWRVSIVQYKGNKPSEQLSKDKVFKYIIDKCFTSNKFTDNFREITVNKPTSHQVMNSSFELKTLLKTEGVV